MPPPAKGSGGAEAGRHVTPETTVARSGIPSRFFWALLVAWSLSLITVVLSVFVMIGLLSILLFPVIVICWGFCVGWLPKGPDGARLAYLAPLILAPILLIAPAGPIAGATGGTIVTEDRAQQMSNASGARHAIPHLRMLREAKTALKFWLWVSVPLGLLAAVLQVWGIRWRTGELPHKTLVVLVAVLFTSFGPLVYLFVRVLSGLGWPLTA